MCVNSSIFQPIIIFNTSYSLKNTGEFCHYKIVAASFNLKKQKQKTTRKQEFISKANPREYNKFLRAISQATEKKKEKKSMILLHS